jgi:hypothetical protein
MFERIQKNRMLSAAGDLQLKRHKIFLEEKKDETFIGVLRSCSIHDSIKQYRPGCKLADS